jgi:flavodoxin I
MPKALQIIYATTSGHTEYVIQALCEHLENPKSQESKSQTNSKSQSPNSKNIEVNVKRAELAEAEDFAKGDVLLLACGTWNAMGREGQLDPHMFVLLNKKAKGIDLAGKQCLVISLGDDRFKYTARATEHLANFINNHGGHMLMPPLVIVNDPYGQEEHVTKWGDKLLEKLSS